MRDALKKQVDERASGSATTAPPTTWFTNLPIDYGKNDGDINEGGTVQSSFFLERIYLLLFPLDQWFLPTSSKSTRLSYAS